MSGIRHAPFTQSEALLCETELGGSCIYTLVRNEEGRSQRCSFVYPSVPCLVGFPLSGRDGLEAKGDLERGLATGPGGKQFDIGVQLFFLNSVTVN